MYLAWQCDDELVPVVCVCVRFAVFAIVIGGCGGGLPVTQWNPESVHGRATSHADIQGSDALILTQSCGRPDNSYLWGLRGTLQIPSRGWVVATALPSHVLQCCKDQR